MSATVLQNADRFFGFDIVATHKDGRRIAGGLTLHNERTWHKANVSFNSLSINREFGRYRLQIVGRTHLNEKEVLRRA